MVAALKNLLFVAEGGHGIEVGAAQGGHESQQNASGRGDDGGESQHAPIERQVEMEGIIGGLKKTKNRAAEAGGNREAERRTNGSKQATLGQ